ncbi:MAG: phosphoglycolate phosphatase [Halofilum sp. (in: g-proteobacteria)]|nr:phosphoglycolate phosphatase [Halofilum sp. (in: g-proteobacteria)]
MSEVDTVLFDLDGTLVDTAPDMTRALDRVLADAGRPPLPAELVRPHVSRGAAGLLALAFGDTLAEAERERLRADFLRYYREQLATASRPFPGMPELLARIEGAGMAWGVVTNKPGWLTVPLLDELGLAARAACIVAGDTLERRKPDPAPLLHACERAGTRPRRAVYVGDDERDVIAGRRAGMRTYVALFGYLGDGSRPGDWGATALVATPADLWPHLRPAASAEAS